MPDMPKPYTAPNVHLPLAWQDLFVSDVTFAVYGAAALGFINEVAQHFDTKADDLFFARAPSIECRYGNLRKDRTRR